ncbi:MAG: Apolipoprotein N-acyltransferase [Parcubacteria group bacterium GW2011_GWA2_47_10]|nr:MAG: Apolipoprotein N-acyltransferase [Parcubacteria group bacterium GW2011_GWA2_47_10]
MRTFLPFLLSMVFFGLSYWSGPLWFLAFFIFPPLLFGMRMVVSKAVFTVFLWGAFVGTLFLLIGLPPLLDAESEVFGAATAFDPKLIARVLGIFAVAAGIFGGVFGIMFVALKLVARKIPHEPLILFVFPALWVVSELVIRVVTFGFDWWFVGIPLVAIGLFRELAGIFLGVPLLSFITVFSGSILYACCVFRPLTRIPLFYISLSLFGLIIFFLYGVMLHERISAEYPAGLPSVAIIQPNVKFPDTFPIERDENYGPLIKKALTRNVQTIIFSAQIVSPVTTESKLSKDFWTQTLGKTLIETDATVIFYIPVKTEGGIILQTMFALQHGEVVGKYKKEILFPVSDYRPGGFYKYLFDKPVGYSITPFVPADAAEKNGLLTPDGIFAAAICNEPFSPKFLNRIKRMGAPILVVSGSDRPFLSNFIFRGTLRMAQLRATEAHVWLFRAYKTGISAIISPGGDIVQRLNRGERGVIYFGEGAGFVEKF